MTFLWLPQSLRHSVINSGGAFTPAQVSAVSAWLRVASSTVTGLGISSLPDVLNTNPAVQGTDALRPPRTTSANGFLLASPSSDVMTWPLAASNNNTTTWGMACHVRTPLAAAARTFFSVRAANGSDVERCTLNVAATEALVFQVNIDDANNRRGTTPISVIGNNTWHFVTFEYDGGQATEAAKCVITVDGVVQTLTFSNGAGAGAMPATMTAAVGNGLLLANNTAGTSAPMIGDVGPNIYVFGGKMAGATTGLLTPEARTALLNFEKPT